MIEPSTYQCRAWQRRAETIQRKAEDLLDDMVRKLSAEHELTDDADNVTHQAEELTENLRRYPDRLKARRAPETPK